MRIITTAIIKGGTGKTTTAAALAQAGITAGKKILAVDMDPQGNLSAMLAADIEKPGSYELLTGTAAISEAIQETGQGIPIIAASPNLASVKAKPGSARLLQDAIEPIKEDYDLILIDTPPQAGILVFTALQASTGLIIPLEADTNSLQGMYHIADIARQIQQSNDAFSFTGVIITRYDARPNLNRYLMQTIKEKAEAEQIPYLGEVRTGIAIKEAQAMQVSLYEYAPRSKPAQDYETIFRKIMEG